MNAGAARSPSRLEGSRGRHGHPIEWDVRAHHAGRTAAAAARTSDDTMWTLARKNLFKERARLAISIGGVAFAVTLMILLRGLYLAYEEKVRGFYDGMHADAWVVRDGTSDKITESVLSTKLGDKLRTVAGVSAVIPYTARNLTFKVGGEDAALFVTAFDPGQAGANTGPLRMVSGTRDIGDAEIIVDKVFAHKHGLQVGDTVTVSRQDLTVGGISSGGDLVTYQTGFVTYDRIRKLLKDDDLVNAYLLRLQPGADLATVAAGVADVSRHTDVKSMAKIVEQSERTVKKGFLPVLGVLLAIAFCVGVAVVGLTIFSAVLEHRRDYGVLKALGARPIQMLVVVTVQALTAAGAGYLAGVGVSLLAARAAEVFVPQFITHLVAGDVLMIGVAALAMGLVAAVIPMRSIARVDPAIVFKA